MFSSARFSYFQKQMTALGVLGILLFAVQPALAVPYTIDGAHSHVGFTIRHLVSKVAGEFRDFSGDFEFDAKKVEASKGKFVVKAASVSTNNDKRDEHLRSPDFFNAENHPDITLENMKLSGKGANLKLTADLTLLGVKKPVKFDVEYLGQGRDPYGNDKVGFTAKGKVQRKDFGMTWNKALDSGNLLLSDEVEVTVQIEANGKK